jgi:ubiquinone/menaquinone biosynthesis C-methylase UbiE
MADQEFDKFARSYDQVLSESIPLGMDEDEYFAEYKAAYASRLLAKKKISRILDFGCGAGRSLTFLAKYFPDAAIVGFDLSDDSLSIAKERYSDAALYSHWLSLADMRFDLIFAANVFHHIPTQFQLLELIKCKAVMAKHGEMIVFEHNPINPATRWIFERCPFDVDAEMIRKKDMILLSSAAGLRVVDDSYTLFFPKQLRALRFLEPYLSWLPLGAQYYVRLEK